MSEKGTAGMIAHPLLSSDMRDRKIKGGEICSVSKWKQRQIYKSLINISSFRTSFLANQIQLSISSFQHSSAVNSTDIWHGDFFITCCKTYLEYSPTRSQSGFSWELDFKLFSGCLCTKISQTSFAFETEGIYIVFYADIILICSCVVQ